jgi:nucleoside-diphosphate-sugar epimerase
MSLPASNGKTVLISGINGYIASVTGLHLLNKGYSVRGTSRRASSAKTLVDGAYERFKDRVETFEVPDITVAGAFDEAVKGKYSGFHPLSQVIISTRQ